MAELSSVEPSTFFGGLAVSIFDVFFQQIVAELSSVEPSTFFGGLAVSIFDSFFLSKLWQSYLRWSLQPFLGDSRCQFLTVFFKQIVAELSSVEPSTFFGGLAVSIFDSFFSANCGRVIFGGAFSLFWGTRGVNF